MHAPCLLLFVITLKSMSFQVVMLGAGVAIELDNEIAACTNRKHMLDDLHTFSETLTRRIPTMTSSRGKDQW